MVAITPERDMSKPYFEGDIPVEQDWNSSKSNREQDYTRVLYNLAFRNFLFAVEIKHPSVEQFRLEYEKASDRVHSPKQSRLKKIVDKQN